MRRLGKSTVQWSEFGRDGQRALYGWNQTTKKLATLKEWPNLPNVVTKRNIVLQACNLILIQCWSREKSQGYSNANFDVCARACKGRGKKKNCLSNLVFSLQITWSRSRMISYNARLHKITYTNSKFGSPLALQSVMSERKESAWRAWVTG